MIPLPYLIWLFFLVCLYFVLKILVVVTFCGEAFLLKEKFLSWARQSNQPVVDLGIGIYLRTNKTRAFTLLAYHTCSLLALCSLGLDFPSQLGHHCCSGKVGQKVVSVCVAPLPAVTGLGHYWPRSQSIPWHSYACICLISKIFPCLQSLFLQPGPWAAFFLAHFWDHCFFLGTLLFSFL